MRNKWTFGRVVVLVALAVFGGMPVRYATAGEEDKTVLLIAMPEALWNDGVVYTNVGQCLARARFNVAADTDPRPDQVWDMMHSWNNGYRVKSDPDAVVYVFNMTLEELFGDRYRHISEAELDRWRTRFSDLSLGLRVDFPPASDYMRKLAEWRVVQLPGS